MLCLDCLVQICFCMLSGCLRLFASMSRAPLERRNAVLDAMISALTPFATAIDRKAKLMLEGNTSLSLWECTMNQWCLNQGCGR